MHGNAGAVLAAGTRVSCIRGCVSAFTAGLALCAVAACSSSQSGKPGAGTRAQSGRPSAGSFGSGGSTGWRVIYHATYVDADPSVQTITLLSDGDRKFRVTFAPPGYADFAVSDGVKEVESIQGLLEYAPTVDNTFIVAAGDLPKVCPKAKPVGSAAALGHTGVRYVCDPVNIDESSEVTVDGGNGILLAAKSETSTITVTSIDLNATIPAGSFDLPKVPTARPTQGLLTGGSPGVTDAQKAASAIERCRTEANGRLPPMIRPTKGPTVILHCGAATETFAVTPGNSVEYQPHGSQYDITVTLPDGSSVTYASSKCPGTPICIDK
jgi:hypothetical protein